MRPLRVVVALSALYALLVFLLPARGITFFRDDWETLYRIVHDPWPARWLAPINEHWAPLLVAHLELEWRIFGPNHTFFLATTSLLHVLNVWLLGRVLLDRTKDEAAAAIGAAAFGLATPFREVLWFAELGGIALSFTISCAGFLAAARAREQGRWLVALGACILLAPLAFGSGLALGPALLVEVLTWEKGRRRALATTGSAIALAVLGYALSGARSRLTPRDAHELLLAASWGVDLLGSGMVAGIFLRQPETAPAGSAGFVLLYALAVVLAARVRRGPTLVSQVHLLLLVVPIALARWAASAPTTSRYEYMLALGWTTPLALLVAKAPRRWLRAAPALLVAFALGHAYMARIDGAGYAPASRRNAAALLRALEALVVRAPGPLYDATLPRSLAWPSTRACAVLSVVAPETSTAFTLARTPDTEAPYRTDPLLRPLVDSPEDRGPWK